ncbi:helix-turn-helix domain-containing protein [Variovorax sp. J31P207]|uniref:AraC-like ligand-binding domain-containing protein n=1 Tax=Variovorax sp. J31P207 TaxID=3053510 RepID=UPI002578ED44|nr:helix-turn-helix domain-containing protein [Variovorax sp. J31P207]MDM0071511.1 helix-turn-helix domain-containing protein [Variovorax sp. J31P207]
MLSTFSTSAAQGESHGFSAWEDTVCRTYVPVRCVRSVERPFSAHLKVQELGLSQLSRIESSAMSYARMADDIRLDSCDDLQFCLMLEGALHVRQAGRQASLKPGDMGLYDASRPFELDFPSDYRALVVKLPRALLATRLAAPERLSARLLPGDARLGALASSMIREAAALGDMAGGQVTHRLSTSLADILALALEVELLGSEPLTGRHAQLLQRVKSYMLEHLADAQLDVTAIAEAHHIAPRTLNRLFAADGTTAIRWLWQQRLAASHKALTEGQVRQVAEAALSFGFSDFSHFSRSFKKAFGVQPHTLVRSPH